MWCNEEKKMEPFKFGCIVLAALGGRHVLGFDFRDAAGIHNASSIKKALNRLEEIGHVYFFHDEYKFTSPFFREWVLRKLG